MKKFVCFLLIVVMTFLTACAEKSDRELKTYGDAMQLYMIATYIVLCYFSLGMRFVVYVKKRLK